MPLSFSRLLQRQKFKALSAFAVGIVLTLAYFALATRYYQSEAKLFVKIGRQNATLDPTATTGQQIAVREIQNQEVFAVQELLSSREIAEAIVDHFGAETIIGGSPSSDDESESAVPSPGEMLQPLNDVNLNPLRVYSVKDKAVKSFGQNLTVLAGKQTNIISLAYESEDPAHSQEVLKKVIELGRDEHREMHSIQGSQEFFVEQADLLRSRLSELEKQLSELKSETGIAALDTQRNNHLGLMGSLRQQLITAQAELAGLTHELDQRRKQQAELPEMIVLERTTDQPMTVAQSVREKLYDLEVQEEELASKITESHPKLVQVRKQISEARAIADEVDNRPSVKTGLNENYQAAQLAILERESQAVALKSRIAALAEDVSQAEAKLIEINRAEVSIRGLEREIELAAANYRTYSENLEQTRIDRKIDDAGISSLIPMQHPTFVQTPASPKPSVTLGLGFILSTILGALVAIRSEKQLLKKELLQGTQATPPTQPSSRPAVRRAATRESQKELVLEAGNGAS